jgi:nucleolar pre-ribosomal-associated protein 2
LAAKFLGLDLITIGRHKQGDIGEGGKKKIAIYHGREEWLLKWLLKRLQATADVEPRYTSLCHSEGSL